MILEGNNVAGLDDGSHQIQAVRVARRHRGLVVPLIVLASLIGRGVAAQTTPLPDTMIAGFELTTGPAAATMHLPNQGGSIDLRVVFDNEPTDKTIKLHYTYGTPTTETDFTTQEEATSFQPTAVCPRAGYDNRLYVAGWDARLSSVVVEAWTLVGANVLGPPITEGWEPDDAIGVVPAFSAPQVQRELLFVCAEMQPILDLSCNLAADELLLLERVDETGRSIRGYSLQSTDPRCSGTYLATAGTPPAVLSSTTLGLLEGMNSFWEGRHAQEGFVIYSTPRIKWKPSPLDKYDVTILLLQDETLDGVLEKLDSMTYGEFLAGFPMHDFEFEYN